MAFFEDLSRKVQDVAFAAAEKGKEVAAIASEKAQDAADTVKTNVAIAGEQRAIEKNYRAASSAVRPRVWSFKSWSPAILPMAAS